jgi:hypothetical protein
MPVRVGAAPKRESFYYGVEFGVVYFGCGAERAGVSDGRRWCLGRWENCCTASVYASTVAGAVGINDRRVRREGRESLLVSDWIGGVFVGGVGRENFAHR